MKKVATVCKYSMLCGDWRGIINYMQIASNGFMQHILYFDPCYVLLRGKYCSDFRSSRS